MWCDDDTSRSKWFPQHYWNEIRTAFCCTAYCNLCNRKLTYTGSTGYCRTRSCYRQQTETDWIIAHTHAASQPSDGWLGWMAVTSLGGRGFVHSASAAMRSVGVANLLVITDVTGGRSLWSRRRMERLLNRYLPARDGKLSRQSTLLLWENGSSCRLEMFRKGTCLSIEIACRPIPVCRELSDL